MSKMVVLDAQDVDHMGVVLWRVLKQLDRSATLLREHGFEHDEGLHEAAAYVSKSVLEIHELGFGLGFPSDRIAAWSFARGNVDPISTNQRTVIVARMTGCDPRKRGRFLF